jgi:hypothetical protein
MFEVIMLLIGLGIGVLLGWRLHERTTRDLVAERDMYEQMLDAKPSPGLRKPGTPTNIDGKPSRVAPSRWAQNRRWSENPHDS